MSLREILSEEAAAAAAAAAMSAGSPPSGRRRTSSGHSEPSALFAPSTAWGSQSSLDTGTQGTLGSGHRAFGLLEIMQSEERAAKETARMLSRRIQDIQLEENALRDLATLYEVDAVNSLGDEFLELRTVPTID